MTDEMILSLLFIATFCMGLLIAGAILQPLGHWIDTRLLPWPDRPMDNQEKRARWALKYHQATPISPNTHRWKWLPGHGTGVRQFPSLDQFIKDIHSGDFDHFSARLDGNGQLTDIKPTKGNDHD